MMDAKLIQEKIQQYSFEQCERELVSVERRISAFEKINPNEFAITRNWIKNARESIRKI